MEKVIGPTISVLQDNIYITGTSEDSLSGTAIYRYDPPNSQGEVKNVDNITTGKYTAPRFELTTSGKWTFYAKDTAGNSNTKQTSTITLYRCNYCNQKTNQLHYRCPTHKDSQTCSTFPSECDYDLGTGTCSKTPCYTGPSYYYGKGNPTDGPCIVCNKNNTAGGYYHLVHYGCSEHYTLQTNNNWGYTCEAHGGMR